MQYKISDETSSRQTKRQAARRLVIEMASGNREERMLRLTILTLWGAAAAWCGTANAEISDGVVRIGVLNDTSGIFQNTNGPGSVEAARMAAEDFAGGGKGIKGGQLYE